MLDRLLKLLNVSNQKSAKPTSIVLRSVYRPEQPTGFVSRTDPSFANLARKF